MAACAGNPNTKIDQDVSEYVVFGRLSSALRSSGGMRQINAIRSPWLPAILISTARTAIVGFVGNRHFAPYDLFGCICR